MGTPMPDPEQPGPPPIEEQRHVFVVRFWQETDAHGARFWRGYITHIPSNAQVHVQQISQLNDFLRRYLQLPE
jgi:hypothetical protein